MGAGFANVFLQPADAAGGGAGNFRLRAEPFARRDFRLPLRGRNCRLPQNIAAFSIAIPSRNEYSAVGKLRKRRVKRSVSSRVMDSRSFTARIECARNGKFGNTGIAENIGSENVCAHAESISGKIFGRKVLQRGRFQNIQFPAARQKRSDLTPREFPAGSREKKTSQ